MNMLLQLDRPAPIKVYKFLVTLIHCKTGDEKLIEVVSVSDRFTDVSREIAHQKSLLNLAGYLVYESIDQNDGF